MLDVSERVAFFLELSHDLAVHGMVLVDDQCWVVAHFAQVLKCLHVQCMPSEEKFEDMVNLQVSACLLPIYTEKDERKEGVKARKGNAS